MYKYPEKKRRESYESLYGLRFPNASVAELDDAGGRYHDDDSTGTSRSDNENLNLSLYIDQEELTPAECCLWFRKRFFTKRKFYRLFPPLSWLPRYSSQDLKGDVISGISVAFTIVPQGLALASLAGLPPQYGLYTSFMGCFIYSLLGSCKDMAVGPTSILAMIVLPYVMVGGPQYSILLSFFGGFVQLFAGFLNLGFIVDFVSFPVISAFSFAAAISISASQLKGFFGLQYSASKFPEIVSHFLRTLHHLNPWDVVLGCCSLAFLLPLQIFKDFRLDTDRYCPYDKRGKRFFCKTFNFLWNLIIIGRNAIAVLIGSLITIYYGAKLNANGDQIGNYFTLTRKITPGLPSFEFPSFELVDGNNTVIKSFDEVSADISTGIFVVSLLGLMESVAVANAFKSTNSEKWDATQEMIALGVSNILGSFVGAFPATGSFSRSAVNHNSGVRTPLGGVITGSLVLAALSTFSSYFENIPETVLATIIITSVIFMAHPSDVLLVYKTNRIDLLPYLVTFASSLLIGLEVGMLIGIAVSISILLYHMARPHIFTVTKVAPNGCPFLYVKPDRSIFFSSVEYMKIKINQNLKQLKHLTKSTRIYNVKQNVVVVDGEHMFRTDSTFALGLKNMVANLRNRNVTVIFYRLRRQVFRAICGVALYPTSFHNCRTEEEVYQLIRTLNETTKLKHSHSLCLSTLQRDKDNKNSILSTQHNELGSRFNWLTQSSKQF